MLIYLLSGLRGLIPMLLLVGPWRIYSYMDLKRKGMKYSVLHEFNVWCMAIYLTVVFSQTISPMFGFSASIKGNINLIPFASMIEMIQIAIAHDSASWTVMNIIGNVLMFVPLGFLLPFTFPSFQKWYRVLGAGITATVFIEFCQLFLTRGTDIDDIILNTVGTMIGYGIFFIMTKWIPVLKEIAVSLNDKTRRCSFEAHTTFLLVIMSVVVYGFIERGGYIL